MKKLNQNRSSIVKIPQKNSLNNRSKSLLLGAAIFLMTCTAGFTADRDQQPGMNAPHARQNAQPINLDRLQRDINTTEARIQAIANQHQQARGKVILIGPSGNGKSTLLHYIADKNLVAEDNAAGVGRQLEPTQIMDGLSISHTPRVGTNFPGAWYDQTNNLVYWDCPGFGDPRKEESDIRNAFAIHHLFENTQVPLKILLVTSESLLMNRGTEFLNLLNNITEKFPDDRLLNCLSLVVTKQDRVNIGRRLNVLVAEEESLNNRAKQLLNHLATHPNQVAVFPHPAQNGAIGRNHKAGILLSINTAQFINDLIVCRTVDNATKTVIASLAQNLNEKVRDQVELDVGRVLVNHTKTTINGYNGPVDTLRQSLATLERDIKALKAIPNSAPDVFVADLEKILGRHQEFEGPKKSISQLKFLKDLNPAVRYQISAWAKALKTIRHEIKGQSTPLNPYYHNHTLVLKDGLIGASEIISLVKNAPAAQQPITEVKAFATNTIFIDKNVTLPGVSISMIAPAIKLDDLRIVWLSGEDGIGYNTPAANGTRGSTPTQPGGRGTNGSPGGHGGHSGSLYVKGGTGNFENFDRLQVLTDGGMGGDGQEGGRGGDGANGLGGNASHITRTEQYFDTYVGGIDEKYRNRPEIRAWINNDDIARHEHKEIRGVIHHFEATGTAATGGGDAGAGGKKGLKGLKGTVIIEGTHWGPHFPSDGVDGEDGAHGSPGQGGIHGKNHYGTVITDARTYVERWHEKSYWHRLPDRWLVGPGYHAATRASNGKPATTLNNQGQQVQAPQVMLNTAAILTEYRNYYWEQYQQEHHFAKPFPGL